MEMSFVYSLISIQMHSSHLFSEWVGWVDVCRSWRLGMGMGMGMRDGGEEEGGLLTVCRRHNGCDTHTLHLLSLPQKQTQTKETLVLPKIHFSE